jgi:DNA-binding MarR family transcriptional regulator
MSLSDLSLESRRLLQAVKQWSERVHQDAPITGAARAVLEVLLRGGPLGVPMIARAQGVSRQHIQLQVDSLLDQDLVERRPNPAHKRSPLMALNDKGRALIETLRAKERNAFANLQTGVSDEALRDAATVLTACRDALVADVS